MKRIVSLLMLAVSLASFPLVTGMTCSQSQQRIAYNTLYSTGLAVNSAYAAYLDLVVQGKVNKESVPQVTKAYNDFQAAFSIAVTAAQMNLKAVAPQNVVDLANSVIGLINTIKGKA